MHECRRLDCLAPLRDQLIGQHDHRQLKLFRDVERFDGAVKRILHITWREHDTRRIAMTSVQRMREIGLLALRRQSGRRSAALHVEDHGRNLRDRRQPEHLRHQ
jgi:hypothetical protein